MEKEKHAGGRPTKYSKQLCHVAKNLALAGYTNEDIAKVIGISDVTLYDWKNKYEEFSKALAFKKIAISKIIGAVFEAAVGYKHKDIIHASHRGEIITKKVTRRYPPNIKAAEVLLRNCDREHFLEKQEVTPPNITLNITPLVAEDEENE